MPSKLRCRARTPTAGIRVQPGSNHRIVHLHELVLSMQAIDRHGRVVRDLMREQLFIPESISVNQPCTSSVWRKKHIAIVLDEFGGYQRRGDSG